MSLAHETGCPATRTEVDEVEGPRGGLGRVNRCLDCGARELHWLTPPAPKVPEPEHAPLDDPDAERENNFREAVLAHVQGRGAPPPSLQTWSSIERRAQQLRTSGAW